MTIQDLKNVDYYTCSLQDINKAYKALSVYVQKMINNGHATANNFKGTDAYNEAKKMHILISRARKGMTPDGYMMKSNNDLNRLPNTQSVL
jgi:hypothetical protein